QARPGLSADQLETLVLAEFSTRLDDTVGGGKLWLHGPMTDTPIAQSYPGSRRLIVTNGDGTNATALFPGEDISSPVISPNGTKIAFASSVDGDYEIYVGSVDGAGTRTKLTNNAISDLDPTWSSDGLKIAYDSGG